MDYEPDTVEMNCVWLEIKTEKLAASFNGDYIDKHTFFKNFNNENKGLYENMMEWQNRVVPYSLPLD